MKKIISLVLAVLMMLSVIPVIAFGATNSGTFGFGAGTVLWELSGSNLYVRRARSDLGDHRITIYPGSNFWEDIRDEVTYLSLSYILAIEGDGFCYFKNLETVTGTAGITSFGSNCFRGCHSLTDFKFPSTLESIGSYAFCDCDSFVVVNLPNSVKTIENRAFYHCSELTTITFPETITTFGEAILCACIKLEKVSLPTNLTHIPTETFSGCKSLKTFWLSEKIKGIGENAFSYTGIEKFAFPEAIKVINENTFYGTPLKSIYIGKNVTKIYETAFGKAPTADIYYGGSEEEWKSISKEKSEFTDVTLHYNHEHNYETELEDYRKPATCINEGTAYMQCVCGAVSEKVLEIDSENHLTFGTRNAVKATCVEHGRSADKYCKDCDVTVEYGKETPFDPDNHNFTTETENVASTCKTKGWITKKCACGKTETTYKNLDYKNHEGSTRIEGAIEPNCVTEGHTGHIVCNSCDGYIEYGKRLDRTYNHIDENHDGICDVLKCKKDFTISCDCRCHDGGLINKIIMFFWKLFRIKRECECGLYHY